MKNFRCLLPLLCGALALFAAGCNSTGGYNDQSDLPAGVKRVEARFFLEVAGDSMAAAPMPISGTRVSIGTDPVFHEFDIAAVGVARNPPLGACLIFQFNGDAGRELYRMTTTNQGRRLVLMLNRQTVGVYPITAPVSNGRLVVYPELDEKLLPDLAAGINYYSAELARQH